MKKKTTSIFKKSQNLFSELDQFGKTIGFEIKGSNSYKSMLGATLTLIITVITLSYGVNKLFIMKDMRDTNFQTVVN